MTAPTRIFTVSELTRLIKRDLETQFPNIWVEGEISGLKIHDSGHCYFSLKDLNAQISCTLWRSYVQRLRFRPDNGQRVLVRGGLNVYEPRGSYSLNVQLMEPKGVGDLALAFEQLKAKLQAEGLFEPERKRKLPFLATRIGIVTSPTGAALQDLLNIIYRRFPNTTVVVSPARVQGAGAGPEIAHAIERLNLFGQVDVIIVGRGGGSMEDLWCFNEEVVARAIVASRIPVVSAVGHEVDFTIADFVADLRAPTPSAAAELVVRDRLELEASLDKLTDRLVRVMTGMLQSHKFELMGLTERLRDPRRKLLDQRRQLLMLEERLFAAMRRAVAARRQRLAATEGRLELLTPADRVAVARSEVARLSERLEDAMRRIQTARQARFERGVGKLDALSPLGVLGRGYAIAQRRRDMRVIQRADQVQPGEEIRVRVGVGALDCRVEALVPEG